MRLAFAVAAHLEPEILIVDEVLAVGDFTFQKKCLGKMGDVAKKEGRTVLFVSHNMSAVKQLCQQSIWLSKGKIRQVGNSSEVVSNYLSFEKEKNKTGLISNQMHVHEPRGLCFNYISLIDKNKCPVSSLNFRDDLYFFVEFDANIIINGTRLGIVINSLEGAYISAFHQTDDRECRKTTLVPGKYTLEMRTNLNLMPGYYTVSLFAKPMPGFWSSEDSSLDFVENAFMFSVEDISDEDSDFKVLPSGGFVLPESSWSINKEN